MGMGVPGARSSFKFQSTSSEEDVVSPSFIFSLVQRSRFQSTSSEEDVVSPGIEDYGSSSWRFNPRPPKRTLCLMCCTLITSTFVVSIHVLRRGRCVKRSLCHVRNDDCFNPRPPKRTLCPRLYFFKRILSRVSIHVLRRGRCVTPTIQCMFTKFTVSIHVLRRGRCVQTSNLTFYTFTRFQSTSSEEDVVSGYHSKETIAKANKFQSTSSEEDVVSNLP